MRERDERFKGKGAAGKGAAGSKRKWKEADERQARADFVKKRRQIGYDADARLGISAV